MISDKKLDVLYKYDKPVKWDISAFGNDMILYALTKYFNFLKRINVKNPIHTIHGSYSSKYNGGRSALYVRDDKYAYDKIREFNSYGIGIKMTFSNPFFSKELLNESALNGYLETLSENKNLDNGIICSCDEFADYIHKNYPNLKVTSSYVKMAHETRMGKTDTVDYYNNLFDKYDIVVFNTFRAFDDEFLDQIKYKDRIEFLVNNSCNTNCQIAHKHYDINYKFNQRVRWVHDHNLKYEDPQVKLLQRELFNINDNCVLRKSKENIDNLLHRQINRDEINHLLSLGIDNFKIEGRDYELETYKYFLFKYIFNNDSIFDQLTICPNILSDPEVLNDINSHKILNNAL